MLCVRDCASQCEHTVCVLYHLSLVYVYVWMCTQAHAAKWGNGSHSDNLFPQITLSSFRLPRSLTQSMNIYINLHFLISFVKLFYSCRCLWERGLFSVWAPSGVEQKDGWKEKERWIHNNNVQEYTLERERERRTGIGRDDPTGTRAEMLYRPSSLFFLSLVLQKENWLLSQSTINLVTVDDSRAQAWWHTYAYFLDMWTHRLS